MAENNIDTNLNEEETLKGIISDTVTGICSNGVSNYPNICKFASRSEEDKSKIINDVFILMTKETIPSGLMGAMAQVDNSLDGWGGDDKPGI